MLFVIAFFEGVTDNRRNIGFSVFWRIPDLLDALPMEIGRHAEVCHLIRQLAKRGRRKGRIGGPGKGIFRFFRIRNKFRASIIPEEFIKAAVQIADVIAVCEKRFTGWGNNRKFRFVITEGRRRFIIKILENGISSGKAELQRVFFPVIERRALAPVNQNIIFTGFDGIFAGIIINHVLTFPADSLDALGFDPPFLLFGLLLCFPLFPVFFLLGALYGQNFRAGPFFHEIVINGSGAALSIEVIAATIAEGNSFFDKFRAEAVIAKNVTTSVIIEPVGDILHHVIIRPVGPMYMDSRAAGEAFRPDREAERGEEPFELHLQIMGVFCGAGQLAAVGF